MNAIKYFYYLLCQACACLNFKASIGDNSDVSQYWDAQENNPFFCLRLLIAREENDVNSEFSN